MITSSIHTYTRSRLRLFCLRGRGPRGNRNIFFGGEGETGGQCGKQTKRSDLHSLPGNGYSTQRDGKRSLLRTNTTRPSKCDRTANTMGGEGEGVRVAMGVAIGRSGNLCAEQREGATKTKEQRNSTRKHEGPRGNISLQRTLQAECEKRREGRTGYCEVEERLLKGGGGFATALKSECTSDSGGGRGFTEPKPPQEPNERKVPACFPEQAKDRGVK